MLFYDSYSLLNGALFCGSIAFAQFMKEVAAVAKLAIMLGKRTATFYLIEIRYYPS